MEGFVLAPPTGVWSVGDFPDFGSRAAVRKTLQRLEEAGRLRRIDPGLYHRPPHKPANRQACRH